jgi:hypothetical protein
LFSVSLLTCCFCSDCGNQAEAPQFADEEKLPSVFSQTVADGIAGFNYEFTRANVLEWANFTQTPIITDNVHTFESEELLQAAMESKPTRQPVIFKLYEPW